MLPYHLSMLSLDATTYRHPGGGGIGPVDFALADGARALVLGPSGSGKTTLVHLVAGLLTPQSGRVSVAGTDLAGLDAAGRDALRRQTIGLVFQTLRLVSALTVSANLALARRLAGRPADPARIAALLDRLGIAQRAGALPRQLSQGEAQRAALARALVTEPRLLIADEPTSALDDVNAAAALALLEQVAADTGAALLVVTHDRRLDGHFGQALRLDPGGRAS
jgi:putative ABC transport system ATP-binding protein